MIEVGRGYRLVFKAHRRVYHSTLGWRVIKKKKKTCRTNDKVEGGEVRGHAEVRVDPHLLALLQPRKKEFKLPWRKAGLLKSSR